MGVERVNQIYIAKDTHGRLHVNYLWQLVLFTRLGPSLPKSCRHSRRDLRTRRTKITEREGSNFKRSPLVKDLFIRGHKSSGDKNEHGTSAARQEFDDHRPKLADERPTKWEDDTSPLAAQRSVRACCAIRHAPSLTGPPTPTTRLAVSN